ncbi:MAG: LacI family transcriptional regulator [Lactobacillus sp.]|nr:LacI family transcriptional regulator [Lactobacillus sp.]
MAAKAGVSIATVSRYINHNGYVSEKAQQKIEAAIASLDYLPNEVARSLSTKTSSLVGVIVPDLRNPYFPQLVEGVEKELKQDHYGILLGSTDQREEFEDYLDKLLQNNVVGIISAVGLQPERTLKIPFVEVDRISGETGYSVTTNDYQGGQLIAQHLLATSSMQHIAIVKGPQRVDKSMNRLRGILDGLAKQKSLKIEQITTSTFSLKDAKVVWEVLDQYSELPDTIIASNDLYAIIIMQKLIERGVRVPEDVQIFGYDGIDFIDIVSPRITTIKQPIYRLGVQTADLLLDIVAQRPISEKHQVLDVAYAPGKTLRL